ncbi:uncharacterized protein LOC141730606 [Zonotrichia albicollis]|uniref:uncharacterized protein LOC141730606 n=1 Tax=Zonotrichia albicollis TaxID=44394 RepID=UPI003D80BD64
MPLPATPPASREPEYHSGPRGPAESAKIPAKIEKKDPVMGAAILPETTCRHGRRHLAGIHVSVWAPPSCRKPRVGMGAAIFPETTCRHGRRHLDRIQVSAWAPPSCRKPRVGMGASILPETTCLHQLCHLSEPRGYPDALDAPPRDAAGLTRTGISFRPPGTRGKRKNPGKNREKRSGHGGRHLAGNHVSAWAPPSSRKPRVGMGASILPETTCLHQRRHLSEPRGYPHALDAPSRDAAGLTRTGISFRPPGTRGKRKNPGKNREKRSGHGGRHLAGNHVSAWAPPSCRKPRVGMGAAILAESTCRYGRRHLAGNYVSPRAPPSWIRVSFNR